MVGSWNKEKIADLEYRIANGLLVDYEGYPSKNALYSSVESMGVSSDPDIRGFVKNILYRLDRERAFTYLQKCLEDPDDAICAGAVEMIGGFGEGTTSLLISILQKDSSPDVRCSAAAMLGYFGTPDAIPLLKVTAENDHELDIQDFRVSSVASHAIKQIKSRYREGVPDRYRNVVSLADEIQVEKQGDLD